MRRLELDFHRAPPANPWRWILLLAGLSALTWVLMTHRQIHDQTHADRAAISAIEARLPATSKTAKNTDNAALTRARQALATSQRPWGDLFAALEKADNKDIALLAFTPDPARGQVKLYAEARNLAAMLAYHRRLEGGALHQVALVEHDMAKESRDAPVRFHIVANWGADHGRP